MFKPYNAQTARPNAEQFVFCGPRGIRTPDLLNAIEARSQLRHGPWLEFSEGSEHTAMWAVSLFTARSGPEGIRTPDLVSAIDARSQLRHRPACTPIGVVWAKAILLEGHVYVKQTQSKKTMAQGPNGWAPGVALHSCNKICSNNIACWCNLDQNRYLLYS
jgi:hypothetical protein